MSDESTNIMTPDIWNRAKMIYLSTLQSEEDRNQFNRYIAMVSTVHFDGANIIVKTINSFAADTLRSTYGEKLKSCISLAGGPAGTELDFMIDESEESTSIIETQNTSDTQSSSAAPSSGYAAPSNSFVSPMPLNPHYVFDEFVIGPSNSWANSAARGVVEHPGEFGYNPLFIHGGTGLGKTHLMQAIGNELHKRNKNLSICYLTAETFLNEYVNVLQNGGIHAFRDKYRNIDVLLVDDVQFLQKGKNVQEEFFNTFNALAGSNKQIVMTSDVAPKYLPAFEARLISRFEGGMVQEIETPSYETRLAILKKKAAGLNTKIADSSLQFIADHIKSHVRAMEGALAKVMVTTRQNPTEFLTNEMLSRLLKDLIDNEQTRRKLTVQEIQQVVAKKFSISVDDILSSERTQSLVTPRQLSMYIARKYSSKSLQEIAALFNKKHATILHGVKTIGKRIEVEEGLRKTLEDIVIEFGLQPNDTAD